MTISNKDYSHLADKKSPDSPMLKNLIFAFTTGGAICVIGQIIINLCKSKGLSFEDASTVASVSLVILSVILTSFNLYNKIATFAGAGTLVPITGFANAVVAPAIEFRSEGYIMGLGAKMFVIAGPVIVYGTVSSVLAGIIYYFIK
ncbi:MAG: stage V sporulation protein AC [Clostridia bacterium]|nr:stage V sporulation protein AC [Clostridia bacterium]